MSEAVSVVLVRHASHGELGRTLTGRMPGIALSPEGRDEARRLAARFAGEEVTAIYSSPLERARETAAAISEVASRPVVVTDALQEIDLGLWTGARFADLESDPQWHRWNRERAEGAPPGGEPFGAVQARSAAALETWRSTHPGGRVVAVSHADVVKALVCHLLGLSADHLYRFDIDPASRSTVIAWPGGGKVVSLNERVAA